MYWYIQRGLQTPSIFQFLQVVKYKPSWSHTRYHASGTIIKIVLLYLNVIKDQVVLPSSFPGIDFNILYYTLHKDQVVFQICLFVKFTILVFVFLFVGIKWLGTWLVTASARGKLQDLVVGWPFQHVRIVSWKPKTTCFFNAWNRWKKKHFSWKDLGWFQLNEPFKKWLFQVPGCFFFWDVSSSNIRGK